MAHQIGGQYKFGGSQRVHPDGNLIPAFTDIAIHINDAFDFRQSGLQGAGGGAD